MEEDKINIEQVREAMKQGEKLIDSADINNNNRQAILIIGSTGTGKSTLASMLHGLTLKSHDPINGGIFKLEIADPNNQSNILIEHKAQSGTRTVNIVLDKYQQNLLVDTPGFGDNRGVTVDVINGYYIKRVFQTLRYVKILFVVTYDNLITNRASQFINVANNLGKALENTDYEQSMAVVITQAPDLKVTAENIVNIINNNILGARDINLSDQAKKFCQTIANLNNKISIMVKPSEKQDNLNDYYKNFIDWTFHILNNNIQPMQNPNIGTTISEQTKESIKPLIEQLRTNINQKLITCLKDIEEYLLDVIKKIFSPTFFDEILDKNTELFKNMSQSRTFLENLNVELYMPNKSLAYINNLISKSNEIDFLKNRILNLRQLYDDNISLDYFQGLNQNQNIGIFFIECITQTQAQYIQSILNIYRDGELIFFDALKMLCDHQFNLLSEELLNTNQFLVFYQKAETFFKQIQALSGNQPQFLQEILQVSSNINNINNIDNSSLKYLADRFFYVQKNLNQDQLTKILDEYKLILRESQHKSLSEVKRSLDLQDDYKYILQLENIQIIDNNNNIHNNNQNQDQNNYPAYVEPQWFEQLQIIVDQQQITLLNQNLKELQEDLIEKNQQQENNEREKTLFEENSMIQFLKLNEFYLQNQDYEVDIQQLLAKNLGNISNQQESDLEVELENLNLKVQQIQEQNKYFQASLDER